MKNKNEPPYASRNIQIKLWSGRFCLSPFSKICSTIVISNPWPRSQRFLHLECFKVVLILSVKYETREFCELHPNLSLYALNKTLLVYGHRYHSNTQERWAQGAILFCFTTSVWFWIICTFYIYQKYQHVIIRPSLFFSNVQRTSLFCNQIQIKTFLWTIICFDTKCV